MSSEFLQFFLSPADPGKYVFSRIVPDSEVRGGIPVVRGTRISVYEVADSLSADCLETILKDFPTLSCEDVEAARRYVEAHPRTERPRADSKLRRLVSEETVELTSGD